MPGMSGFDVLAKLKESEETKNIPVIFITGVRTSGSEHKGLDLGAVEYITKPFDQTVVKLRIRNQMQIINLQRHLEAAVKQAQAANLAKSAFLANMNHEIRTPVNVIAGLTDVLLEDDSLPDSVVDFLEKISASSNTLMNLVNDVLDLSKIEAGKYTLTPVRYETAKLINDVISLNIMRITDKPITFQLEVDENLYNELHGDDMSVKQIITNLLSNAMKYTREGTVTLNVKCSRESDDSAMLYISISDTGIGMRQEDLDKVFTEYGQADAKINRSIEGTGLGLPIAKKLAGMMGGDITVESEYGKGSTFSVSLKQGIVSDELISADTIVSLKNFQYEDSERKATRKLTRPDLSYARVLVVDDFAPNLDVASGLLGKYKMSVDCVMSGKEAVELIKLGDPVYDAVFMDHMMHEMDGIEATKTIRKLGTEYATSLPVIALTANAVAENERMFLENGFQAFVPKPIDLKKLDTVIREWIMRDETGDSSLSYEDETGDEQDEKPPAKSPPAQIQIPGINSKLGISLYGGDKDLFIRVLQAFVKSAPAELDKLRSVSEQNLEAYGIDVHTLKGGSASVGAKELSLKAADLEEKAKSGNLAGVLEGNEDFIKETEKLLEDIEKWLENT